MTELSQNQRTSHLTPQQTAILIAGMKLLNWDIGSLTAFLYANLKISRISDLPSDQVDTFFDLLNLAISDWQLNRIPGSQPETISSLSCQYWEARRLVYPQAKPVKKKRKGPWILAGYNPPKYTPKYQHQDLPLDPIGEPLDRDYWERFQYPDLTEWYLP